MDLNAKTELESSSTCKTFFKLHLYFVDGQVPYKFQQNQIIKTLSENHKHFWWMNRQMDGRENSIPPNKNTVCGWVHGGRGGYKYFLRYLADKIM